MDAPRRSTRLNATQQPPLPSATVIHDDVLAPPIAAGTTTSRSATATTATQPAKAPISKPVQELQQSTEPPNTFGTLLVVVYNTDLNAFTKGPYKQGRAEAAGEVKECYTRLINQLRDAGLRVTARPGISKGKEGKEVWLFVRFANEDKLTELVQREKHEDFLHSVSATSLAPISSTPHHVTQGDQIRLLHQLFITSTLQGGLGITPGEGEWKRVTTIIPLQDERANQEWVKTWLTKKWTVGLQGIDARERDRLAEHFGPSVSLYFSFLSFYTRALVPLSILGAFFWLGSKGIYARLAELVGLETWARTGGPRELGYGWSWSYAYAGCVALWAVGFVEAWRVQERKIAVQYGTHKVSRVEHLRPQYLASLSDTSGIPVPDSVNQIATLSPSPRDTEFLKREAKMATSVPVLVACGTALGALLTGIFIFEAFFAHLYDGPGKQLLSLVPTLMFVGVVPNIVAILHKLGKQLTVWENHPTKSSFESSLTIKTFAINAIVAYLGLFLSAYVYVPFGEMIMSYFSGILAHQQNTVAATSAEGAGMGVHTDIAHRTGIKGDRLVNQLFAYTVTNQAINAFTEMGLPYIKQYYEEWRGTHGKSEEDKKQHDRAVEKLNDSATPEERRLMEKVAHELHLPEYSAFGDYAEMVTQFGYVAVWSVVWPLAPVFALINDYVELRSDAIKICNHVQRPVGERVESIGPWLNALSLLSWIAFVTNATLTYLFRPSFENSVTHQSINPNVKTYSFANYGSNFLYNALNDASRVGNKTVPVESTQSVLPAWIADSHVVKTILPMAIPTLFVGLLASHSYLLARSVARWIAEKVIWQGSEEAHGLQRAEEMMKKRYLAARMEELNRSTAEAAATEGQHPDPVRDLGEGVFWKGIQDGNDAVMAALKME